MTDPAPIVSADELRMATLRRELEEADRQAKQKAAQEAQLHSFTESFMKEHVSEQERALIRRLVMNAVDNGKFEAMVYSFSSDLCSDSGRAINNGQKDWPDTLQGKARELYDRYQQVAKPQGFKLKAMIINFPGGMPGDVGFFLSWAPETV